MDKRNTAGFTLIELSFAVLFIAILLLTIAMITAEITNVYRKGVSLKSVNRVGRELIEDLTTSITNSPSAVKAENLCSGYTNADVCISDKASKLSYLQVYYKGTLYSREAKKVVATSGDSTPLAGTLCTGQYSYVWNTAYLFSDDYRQTDINGGAFSKLLDSSAGLWQGLAIDDVSGNRIVPRLLRFTDPERLACKQLIAQTSLVGTNKYPTGEVTSAGGSIVLSGLNLEDSVELISSDSVSDDNNFSRAEAPLALYDFYLAPLATTPNSDKLFYSGSFILATISGGVNIMTASNHCQIPDDASYSTSGFSYCAVNKFNFAAQSSNV